MENYNSIVFYCKDCGAMFFASINDPEWYDDDLAKDVSEYLKEGHRMETVDNETVRANFNSCTC